MEEKLKKLIKGYEELLKAEGQCSFCGRYGEYCPCYDCEVPEKKESAREVVSQLKEELGI